MCLLNGEVSGNFPFEVDLGKIEEYDTQTKTVTITPYPLIDIIREVVHHYGGEHFSNIIVNDLEDRGLILQEYKLDTPLYLIRNSEVASSYIQGTISAQQRIYALDPNTGLCKTPTFIGSLQEEEYDSLVSTFQDAEIAPTKFTFSSETKQGTRYCAAKIGYGQTVGYTTTDMTYTGDLIAKPGESITSVLDKIKNMLGNFEYFYDLDGRFIFQEKKNYINSAWSPVSTTEEGLLYVDPSSTSIQFSFMDSKLITQYSYSPQILNAKNDYSVWGNRPGSGGAQVPIHMRYAIDDKPIVYVSYDGIAYISELVNDNVYYETIKEYLDLYHPGMLINDNLVIDDYQIDNFALETDLQKHQVTLYCDWREIIYQMAIDYRKHNHDDDYELKIAQNNPQYPTGRTGYEQYYIDIEGFWRQLYNPEAVDNTDYYPHNHTHKYWNRAVYECPEQLNFWFDFLDGDGELADISVRKIGQRPKVVNDKDVKAIYYADTPQVIFGNISSPEDHRSGYITINVPSFYEGMFSQSAQGKSAKDAIDNLLYQHSYCTESCTITTLPIYTLQPNKRIYVKDQRYGIDGEYLLTKFTIPLSHNGTMSLTTSKMLTRII